MIAETTETVKYYLTRAQLCEALACAIDGHQEYLAVHGLSAEAAIVAGINEVFEGLDADKELHQQDGEPLTLQLPDPTPNATIAELMRQRDQAQFEAYRLRAVQPGRYAFHFRHLALCYVLQHAPEVYNAAHADAYARIATDGALAYDDVVARLEAQVAALQAVGQQAHAALCEAHRLLEAIPIVGEQPLGRARWWSETGPAAIAALEKAGVLS